LEPGVDALQQPFVRGVKPRRQLPEGLADLGLGGEAPKRVKLLGNILEPNA
jgi:hypothetical protein